jgi:hypothetical protein
MISVVRGNRESFLQALQQLYGRRRGCTRAAYLPEDAPAPCRVSVAQRVVIDIRVFIE